MMTSGALPRQRPGPFLVGRSVGDVRQRARHGAPVASHDTTHFIFIEWDRSILSSTPLFPIHPKIR